MSKKHNKSLLCLLSIAFILLGVWRLVQFTDLFPEYRTKEWYELCNDGVKQLQKLSSTNTIVSCDTRENYLIGRGWRDFAIYTSIGVLIAFYTYNPRIFGSKKKV